MPTIGIMHSGSPTEGYHTANIETFVKSLEKEYGNTVKIFGNGPVWAYNDSSKLKKLADALLKGDVDLIVAAGGSRSAEAAIQATKALAKKKRVAAPAVVFTSASHSVANNPSMPGNATGACAHTSDLDVARLDYLTQVKPNEKDFGVLVNSNRSDYKKKQKDALDAFATQKHLNKLSYQDMNTSTTPKKAFQAWQGKIDGALVAADPFFNDTRQEIVDLGGNIPLIFQWKEFVEAGGLMSYGLSISRAYTEAGKIAGAILKTPNTIPKVWEPKDADFELVINQTTADKLRLVIPQSLLDKATIIKSRH